MHNRDKEPVSVICKDCKNSYNVKFGTYRKNKSKENFEWVCKTCMNIRLYNNLSDKEKEIRKIKQSLGLHKWIDNLSSYEKQQRSIKRSEISKNTMANLSDDKFNKIMSALWNGNRKYFDSLSKSDKKIHVDRMLEGRKIWWDSLSYEEQCERLNRALFNRSNVGPSEHQLNSILHRIGFIDNIHYRWGFNTKPYIHSDYYNRFGTINPITKGINCPYKNWDFIFYTNDGENILVDIDGSIHLVDYQTRYPNGITYSNLEYTKYLESQRKYQIPTDMRGYVILCYDDELTDQTPVQSFQSNEIMSFDELMALLKLQVLPPDDICKIGYELND